jgi:predicted Zn-dependent protease
MSASRAITCWVAAALSFISHRPVAHAQADVHARAIARASCQSGKQSPAIIDARAALERQPDELGVRMRLADALVDQGCYQEAMEVLEAGQQSHPRNSELAGKLRDVRSLVTEQTYIEDLTQAAESAKFQRNQLRCTRLEDVTACDDALKLAPDDVQLMLARGDALMQGNRPAEAVEAYRHLSQLKPADEAVKTKLAAAEALLASTQPAPTAATQVAAVDTNTTARAKPARPGGKARHDAGRVAGNSSLARTVAGTGAAKAGAAAAVTSGTTVAALEPATRTYSNDAPAGRTN